MNDTAASHLIIPDPANKLYDQLHTIIKNV